MVPSSVNVSCDSLFTVNYIKLSNVVPCLGDGVGGQGQGPCAVRSYVEGVYNEVQCIMGYGHMGTSPCR